MHCTKTDGEEIKQMVLRSGGGRSFNERRHALLHKEEIAAKINDQLENYWSNHSFKLSIIRQMAPRERPNVIIESDISKCVIEVTRYQ